MRRSFAISVVGILIFVTLTGRLGLLVNMNAVMGGVVVYLLLAAAVRWQAQRALLAAPPVHGEHRALWAGPARMRGSFRTGLLFATGRDLVYRGGGAEVTVLPLGEIRKIEAGWFQLSLQMASGEAVTLRVARPRRWEEALERLRSLKSGMVAGS